MPASFDDPLTIDKGCLTPSGPLGLAAGETATRLDIWIFQDGAACRAFLPSPQGAFLPDPPHPGGKWTMNPNPHDNHFGKPFQPGEAKAMGLMVKRDATGQVIVEQWDRPINLVDK